MKICSVVFVALALVGATGARGEDVWAVQGFAHTPIDACSAYRWQGDMLFHSEAATPVSVKLLDVSSGPPASPDREFTILPGHSTSLGLEGKNWIPGSQPPIWVVHLDVPAQVTVESRILIGVATCTGLPPSDGILGKLSFPVYRSLQPANVTKVHVGTDLGTVIRGRNNVAVYNAGASTAHVHAEVRQICNDIVLDARDFDVPANTLSQVNGLSTIPKGCPTPAWAFETYVAVTSDQPSLSWVSSISNDDGIKVVYAVTSSSP